VLGAVGISGGFSCFLLATRGTSFKLSVRPYPLCRRSEHLFVTRSQKIVTPASYHPVKSL